MPFSFSEEDGNRTSETKASPVDKASFLSVLFYTWVTRLISLGARQPLEQADVWVSLGLFGSTREPSGAGSPR